MSRKIYLNKREGVAKEIAAVVAILLAVMSGLWLLYRVFFATESNLDEDALPNPTLTSGLGGEGGCFSETISDLNIADFQGSPRTCSTLDAAKVWTIVRESPYVKGNKLYETVLNNTAFIYDARNDSVNAFATSVERQQVKRPVVCLLGGATRFAKLIATALAYDLCDVKTNATAILLSKMSSSDCFTISETRADELSKCVEDACTGLCSEEVARINRAKSDVVRNELLNGILLGILAHEAGHQAYGHVHNQDENRSNLEISRNQERDADSFCASVMSSSPYGKYMFEGTVFWWWVLARQEVNEKSDSKRSHPLSRERFQNMVRANKRMAQKLGITELERERLWQ